MTNSNWKPDAHWRELDRIALARQRLLTAVETVKPATKYDLYDLQPAAMAVYNDSGLLRFRELELFALLSASSPQAAAKAARIDEAQLDWHKAFYAKLTRFFDRFRSPPYWFKEAVMESLMAAYHHTDRFLTIPWEIRDVDSTPRPWYYLAPDGTQSDDEYVEDQVSRFTAELHTVIASVRPSDRVPHTRLSEDEVLPTDVVDEWAALWITGESLEEIKDRRLAEFRDRPTLPEEMMGRLELVRWSTSQDEQMPFRRWPHHQE